MEKEENENGGQQSLLTGGPSPELKASVFSILTKQWVQPLITLGNKKPLQAEDLYDLIPIETTLRSEQRWLKAIANERRHMKRSTGTEKTGEFLSVWKLIYRSLGNEFLLGCLSKPIYLVAVVLQVYTLRELVQIVERSDRQRLHWWWATILVLGMLVTATTQSISQHLLMSLGQKTGIKARATVAMAVFHKLQSMRLVSVASTNPGIMLNLVTNDTQKIVDAASYLNFAWFSVVEIAVVGGLMIFEAGVSAIPGAVMIFLTLPYQITLAQYIGKIRRIAIKYTDSRVQSVNEVLTGVRVVKFNGWTASFLKRIGELRAAEIRWIRRASFFRASTSTFRNNITPLASLVTFGTYVAIHGGAALTASFAFTLLALFNILVRVFAIAPAGVQYASEAIVAFQRLQKLLDLLNGNGFSTPSERAQVSATNPDAAVFICNGTFTWSLQDEQSIDKEISALQEDIPQKYGKLQINDTPVLPKSTRNPIDAAATLTGINLEVKRSELVAIVGSVGSGKTSLLLALLGEMECLTGVFKTDRPVAYAPQQPWILNLTIQANILFGNKYDELRYKQTITACALDHDIAQLPAGHETEIGERGVNLSGGQKARVSLARACYSASPVVLLDDPLAAVDVPTAKHLMDHVLAGMLKERTVILVTHNKTSLSLCDRVYLMEHGTLQELPKGTLLDEKVDFGIFNEQETGEEVKNNDQNRWDVSKGLTPNVEGHVFAADSREELRNDNCETMDNLQGIRKEKRDIAHKEPASGDIVKHAQNPTDAEKDMDVMSVLEAVANEKATEQATSDNVESGKRVESLAMKNGTESIAGGRLTVKEDRVEGVVTWKTYVNYAKDGGGLAFFTLLTILFLFAQAVRVMVDYWLSVWVDGEYHLSTKLYVISYASFVGGSIILSLLRGQVFTQAAMLSAKHMHAHMAKRVLRSPQSFFDQNPIGRILNRFSKDQALVDESLPPTAQTCLENFVGCFGTVAIVGILMPWYLLCVPPFLLVFLYLQRQYVAVSRELKRLDGLSRSPMYAHFSQTLQGIASVRAFGAEDRMHDQFTAMIDANHRAYILWVHVSRWLGIRLDFAISICTSISALLVVLLRHKINAGIAGVILVQSMQLTGTFQIAVRQAADTEIYFTSVERIQAYSNLPTEADSHTKSGIISEDWPQRGEVEFVHYTMAYREDLHPVLNDLCFKVRAQEKVGILGRTGAGKSSLAAALFRLVENNACSGSILVDGVDITQVGLDDLRQCLSIIPQDPVLFKGSVRLNLDPFEQHTDVEINDSIARVHLSKKVESLDKGIDSLVAENGDNFSIGQRQLLCLARSLLRRSQVIVMDEATAAVDGETDLLIQRAMRGVFQNCTVLTIAHRIDTIIDCDRVLVLAKGGSVSEFDTPVNLLRRAERLSTSTSQGTTPQPSEDVNYGFADIVSQSGAIIAKQLREAAEAAELRRQKNSDSSRIL